MQKSTRLTGDLEQLAVRADRELQGADALEILRWAGTAFGPRLVVASSMADTVLVYLAAHAVPGVDVLFLDTGYHFPETIGTRDAVAAVCDITLVDVAPVQTVAEQDARFGARLHDRDPDLCCRLRKVVPLNRALGPYLAWATGVRREESPIRAATPVVGYDAARGMVKINPLAHWTEADLQAYAARHQIIVNPLLDQGYASVGCAPCTRPSQNRDGRWAGAAKTECGIHT
ncbi:phosphoadenosine phosphosulfate reductase [Catenulispora sp. MAP5-51]|uniref:phosphoadenylyl-sulfate reductase n=1 Tax=Catenulispora sp. MAP5-51 TaxID=3156298 RepID=UPI003512C37A